VDDAACWSRLAERSHGVLATVHATRGVDLVPVVFIVDGGSIVIPIDTVKAKRSTRLQRVVNLERDPRCGLLVEYYDDDWSTLWWVRVHGKAMECAPTDARLALLAARFGQYAPEGAVASTIVLAADAVTGWEAVSRSG
jgi:PPOX class probable F420-dependent enzyme